MKFIDDVERKKEVLKFLKNIGVDTRFVSVMESYLLINNLRFSKFSKAKETIFINSFPEFKVIRSKIFQKICLRSSRVLSTELTPREKILVKNEKTFFNELMLIILEPYTRKYGIQILCHDFKLENLNDIKIDYDSIALPLTLDDEVENILNCIFTGKKIELKSSEKYIKKLIYPFINVPLEWIFAYFDKQYDCRLNKKMSHDFLLYIEKIVPQVRENILKSSNYLYED